MKYISTVEAGKKWGISSTRVLMLAKSGRINGAIQISYHWMIPENAKKPVDARTRNSNNNDIDFFRFPSFAGRDLSEFNPALNDIEQQIKIVTETFLACEYEKAEKLLKPLLDKKTNKYHEVYILYMACHIYFELVKVKEFFRCYERFNVELLEDFDGKTEMVFLLHEFEATLGISNYFVNEFNIDYSYKYDDSFSAHLSALAMISLNARSDDKLKVEDLLPYECLCSTIQCSNNYLDLQTMHFYLGIEYGKLMKIDEMNHHYRIAFKITYDHKLYYQAALLYYYYGHSFNSVLKQFPTKFVHKIKELSEDIHNRYLKFMKLSSKDNIFSLLPSKDFIYVYFALQGYSIKEMSNLLHISTSNIGNKYSSIYQKLGVTSKTELIDYYKKSVQGK